MNDSAIVAKHSELFPNYVFMDVETSLDLMAAEIHTLRMERGEVATQTVGISGASAAMQAGGMPRRDQNLPDATSPGPDWGQLESDVFRKIRLLRAAWEHTAKAIPKGHEAMKRDLYVPALSHLAAFCGCVEEDSDD